MIAIIQAPSGDVSKESIGLGNVDNTSDSQKPVSEPQQEALDAKQGAAENLVAFAAIVGVADKGVYFTAPGALAMFDISSVGRGFLALTSPSAQRTALGLGSMAEQMAEGVDITGGTIQGITALAIEDGGTGATNVSDVRGNLELGDSALCNIGTTAGTVAAGDDARITGAVQMSGNYTNPDWLTGVDWSKISGTPTTLSNIAGLSGVNGSYVRFTGSNNVELRTAAQVLSDVLNLGNGTMLTIEPTTSAANADIGMLPKGSGFIRLYSGSTENTFFLGDSLFQCGAADTLSADFLNRELVDFNGEDSLAWGARTLKNEEGITVLYWGDEAVLLKSPRVLLEVGATEFALADENGNSMLSFITSSAAGTHTRMKVEVPYEGEAHQVKIGPDNSGPGGVGRALYIDNAP